MPAIHNPQIEEPSRDSTEHLIKIPKSNLPELRDLFVPDYPNSIFAYYFIENYINWFKKSSNVSVDFYSIDGNWRRDGTFLGYISDQNYVMIYSTDPKSQNWDLMAKSGILKWKEGLMIGGLHSDLQEPIIDSLKNTIGLEPVKAIPCHYHWLPKEKALEYDVRLPEGFYFGDLDEGHASCVNSYWPHKFPNSEKFVRDQIVFNGGLGLFHEETNALVCWVLLNNYGGLGILHTLQEWRRKGLGEVVTKEFSRRLARQGRDVFAATVFGNVSEKMFLKLGFKTLGVTTWYQF